MTSSQTDYAPKMCECLEFHLGMTPIVPRGTFVSVPPPATLGDLGIIQKIFVVGVGGGGWGIFSTQI